MGTSRSTVGVAVLDGKLYAVGGRDGCSCLNSAEAYDPHTNKWTFVSSMIHRRGGKFDCPFLNRENRSLFQPSLISKEITLAEHKYMNIHSHQLVTALVANHCLPEKRIDSLQNVDLMRQKYDFQT